VKERGVNFFGRKDGELREEILKFSRNDATARRRDESNRVFTMNSAQDDAQAFGLSTRMFML